MQQFSLKVKADQIHQSIPDVIGVTNVFRIEALIEVSYKGRNPCKWKGFVTAPQFTSINPLNIEMILCDWLCKILRLGKITRKEVVFWNDNFPELDYEQVQDLEHVFKNYLNDIDIEDEQEGAN